MLISTVTCSLRFRPSSRATNLLFTLVCKHQEAYEVLVLALENGAELGECVQAIETELAKRELPGDVRRADREVRVVQCYRASK